ncbi:MAG: hypothetical protein LBF64_05700 [Oscillospiraceae bacterium]|jgi:hypothetical protein|nr:hypothetical protein [Oscillospiraceae bacterium]
MKRFAPIAGCALAFLIALWVLQKANKDVLADEGYDAEIVMNEISSQHTGDVYYCIPCLPIDDFVPMRADELCDYYGINIFPPFIPDGLNLSNDNSVGFGIYKNIIGIKEDVEKSAVYWDQNAIIYGGDEQRYLRVTVAKKYLLTGPNFAVGGLEGEKSAIHGNEVLMGHCVDENGGDIYYAKWVYRDVQFLVTGRNVSESEFIKTVASIFASGRDC